MDGFEAQGYAFGSFRLVPRDQILLKDGAPVDLTPQMFEVLHLLVRRHGHLVEREELIGHLWPDTVVGENSLSQCIYLLRKVLDDGNRENGPSVIETVPRRGYRFTVDVRTLTEDVAVDLPKPSASQIPKPQTGDSQTAESPANRPLEHSLFRSLTARRTIAFGALAALVLLAMAALRLGRQGQSRDIAVINPRSLSVLPFDNLSPMPAKGGDEYIAKGLTQELSAEFARLPGVKVVIGRLPSAKPGDGIDPHAVGSSLHVENILVGSVRESGAQYRVTVQLIKTSDGQELWSGVYTASVADIPSVEEQVIRHAADVLQVPWSASNDEQWTRRRVEDPKAHDLYLQGRYFWSKRDMASMQRSIELLHQAIAQDPTYARAYAGLADTFAVMAANGQMPAGEALPKARAAAAKALELDPTMAEPHATLGLLLFEFDWDFPSAEEEFRKALALNPNYATGHHWAGLNLTVRGRFEDADAELRKAQELDPLSPQISEGRFENYFAWHKFDDAIDTIRELQARNPAEYADYSWAIARALEGKKQYRDAELIYRARYEQRKDDDGAALLLAHAEAMNGERDDALAILKRAENNHKPDTTACATICGKVRLALGDREGAIAYLQRELREHNSMANVLRDDPDYDDLRNDPRYWEVLQGIYAKNGTLEAQR